MAIERDGIKYACLSCIKGHRVKKCQHHDRELVAILKRGRQISQCKHCRDLRTTHRTHVKCTCAIASVPNPLNGCLCEVIHHCNCVASHLRDTSPSPAGEHLVLVENAPTTLPEIPTIPLLPVSSGDMCHDGYSPQAYTSLGTEKDVFDFLTGDMDQLLAS